MFVYCKNNPVNLIDPSGFAPKWLKNIWNKTKQVVKKVMSVVIDVMITVHDASNETELGTVSDAIYKVKGGMELSQKGKDAITDKLTHVQNVVGVGSGDENYKVKQFKKDSLNSNPEKYIKRCESVYGNMTLLVECDTGSEMSGLTWNEMTSEVRTSIYNTMPSWDHRTTNSIAVHYGWDMVKIAIEIIY